MSSCGPDENILRGMFDKLLLDNIDKLKPLFCCDGGGGGGGGGTPGTPDGNTFVTAIRFEATDQDPTSYKYTLFVTRNDGQTLSSEFAVPKEIGGGGGQSGPTVTGLTSNGLELTLTLSYGNEFKTTLTAPQGTDNDTKLTGGAFDGSKLTLTNSDGSDVEVDFSTLSDNDTKLTGGSHANDKLTLNNSDGTTVEIPLTLTGAADGNTKIQSFTTDAGTKELVITDTDGGTFKTDIAALIPVPTDNDTTVTRIQYINDKFELHQSNGDILSAAVPAAPAPAFSQSPDTPASTTGTPLPTTMIGGRTVVLGAPALWVEISVDGQGYLMPVWRKP